jgi:hypothetical protein
MDDRPTSEMVREVTESTRQMFEAGERVMSDLAELQERAERTLDWPSRILENPVALLGIGRIKVHRILAAAREEGRPAKRGCGAD